MRTKSKTPLEHPPANLEEVKRRFIRQNRELAKANSTQSLRIRSLELDNSRLLDEILQLRERNLWLERERQDAQVNASNEAIQRIKDELHAKFTELNGFVESLAGLRNDASSASYMLPKEKLLSPSSRQYRERQPLAELMQDCIMPTISEDKMFPQFTLQAEDIHATRLSDHSSDGSPDLGPPPIAHFDCDSTDQAKSPAVEQEIMSTETPVIEGDEHELTSNVSVNLETRRRRREGQSKLDAPRQSAVLHLSGQPEKHNGASVLRTGSKRKLADRDQENPIKPPCTDEFTFSRKPTGPNRSVTATESRRTHPDTTTDEQIDRDTTEEPSRPTRRVLSNKSTNISPQKAQSKPGQPDKDGAEKAAPTKVSVDRHRAQPRIRRASSVPLSSKVDEPATSEEVLPSAALATESVIQLPPKTPATMELFSPSISENSIDSKSLERGDTPPPADLSTISNTTDGGQRPSRRARSAVNYAEPSLVAKMRRPGKEMVDAISGIQDPRRTIHTTESRKSNGVTPSSLPPSLVKAPSGDDDIVSWKDGHSTQDNPSRDLDPGSPLRSRTTYHAADLTASSNIPGTDMKTTSKPETEGPGLLCSSSTEKSGSSMAISALIATSRKRRESAIGNSVSFDVVTQQHEDADEAARKIEEMNLYEFKESSSPAPETVESRGKIGASIKGTSVMTQGSQRRHSSTVKDVAKNNTTNGGVGVRRERVASRRRSTFL